MCLLRKPKFKNKFTLKEWSYIVKSHLRRLGIDLYKKPTFVGSFTITKMREELFWPETNYEKEEFSVLFNDKWLNDQVEDYSKATFTVLEWDKYGMLELHKTFEGSMGALRKTALLSHPYYNERPMVLKVFYNNSIEPEVIVYLCDQEHCNYMYESVRMAANPPMGGNE